MQLSSRQIIYIVILRLLFKQAIFITQRFVVGDFLCCVILERSILRFRAVALFHLTDFIYIISKTSYAYNAFLSTTSSFYVLRICSCMWMALPAAMTALDLSPSRLSRMTCLATATLLHLTGTSAHHISDSIRHKQDLPSQCVTIWSLS